MLSMVRKLRHVGEVTSGSNGNFHSSRSHSDPWKKLSATFHAGGGGRGGSGALNAGVFRSSEAANLFSIISRMRASVQEAAIAVAVLNNSNPQNCARPEH